ncbi:MAG: HAD hydrolase-like protein [Luteococcus japonicus]
MTSAVIFDMDDTLLATREVKWAHHKQVAREHYGIDLTDEVLARHWGEPFDLMIGHLYQHSASVEEMRAANQTSAHLFPKQAIPGAVDAVTTLLDRGLVVGVLTSMNTANALADLTRCGFPMDRLVFVQGADQTPHHKPDPRVFTSALEMLHARGITEVSYVGDALIDEQAALGAGLRFVAVTTGLATAEAFEDSPVITSLVDLPALV